MTTIQTSITIPDDLLEKIREKAIKEDRTISKVISRLCEQALGEKSTDND
jgi:metal-responsive CopG/Arc/MetJ family transcriptional regulator